MGSILVTGALRRVWTPRRLSDLVKSNWPNFARSRAAEITVITKIRTAIVVSLNW